MCYPGVTPSPGPLIIFLFILLLLAELIIIIVFWCDFLKIKLVFFKLNFRSNGFVGQLFGPLLYDLHYDDFIVEWVIPIEENLADGLYEMLWSRDEQCFYWLLCVIV